MAAYLITYPTSSANCYVTQAEANSYFQGAIHGDAWDAASNEDKDRALVTATRMLDRLRWTGSRASTSQDLAFPRSGVSDRYGVAIASTVIPTDLKEAVYELAASLIDNSAGASGGSGAGNVKAIATSRTRIEFFSGTKTPANGVPAHVRAIVAHMLYARNLAAGGASYGTSDDATTGTPSQFEARNKYDKTGGIG